MQKPVVSVAITTYNKEKFVRKTLQSVVSQVTDFSYEVVIGDDNSMDGTRKIIKEFQKKYPDKIQKLIFNRQNEGVSVLFPKVLQSCEGAYIATLDGDDYWTDPLKLQKQYDFLKENPDYKICCTDYTVIDQNGNILEKDYLKGKSRKQYQLKDILQSITPPRHTSFFRTELIPDPFPENYQQAKVNDDHYFFALIAKGSDIAVLDINAANYRKHTGGIYSQRPFDYKVSNLITTNVCMLNYFKEKEEKNILKITLFGLYSRLSRYYLIGIKPIRFFKSYGEFVKFAFQHQPGLFFKFNYHLVMSMFSKKMRVFEME